MAETHIHRLNDIRQYLGYHPETPSDQPSGQAQVGQLISPCIIPYQPSESHFTSSHNCSKSADSGRHRTWESQQCETKAKARKGFQPDIDGSWDKTAQNHRLLCHTYHKPFDKSDQ